MVVVDVRGISVFCQQSLFVGLQDYFTKWVEVISLPDQTAKCIACELVKLFTKFRLPDVLHSDQGRNYERTILSQTLNEFGVMKARITAYHHQCGAMVEWFNHSLLQLLHTC